MRRFLKWKWLVSFGLLLAMLTVALPLVYLWNERHRDRLELQKIIAQLDAEDPNWKLDDLVNEHNTKLPPPERNPATIVQNASAVLPLGSFYGSLSFDELSKLPFNDLSKLPYNCVLSKLDHDAYVKVLKRYEPALLHARQLAGYPEGGQMARMTRSPLKYNSNSLDHNRELARLLNYDVILAVSEGRASKAIQSARAGLGVGRAIGTEPSAISQLVRIAADAVACSSVERILNLGEPKEGVAELQADLLQQSKFPYLFHMSRINRAEFDRYFELFESGELTDYGGATSINRYLDEVEFLKNLPLNHATGLTVFNQYIAASKLPLEQQRAAVMAIPLPRDGDRRYYSCLMLIISTDSTTRACFRIQGQLAAAAVGVACERYRQKFGQWPLTLGMISKDILAEIPIDPFTGKPIVYKRLPDGIAVYTVGPDLTDDGGVFYDPATDKQGKDYGIRIYDPALRRQPALPQPAEGAEPEQP